MQLERDRLPELDKRRHFHVGYRNPHRFAVKLELLWQLSLLLLEETYCTASGTFEGLDLVSVAKLEWLSCIALFVLFEMTLSVFGGVAATFPTKI